MTQFFSSKSAHVRPSSAVTVALVALLFGIEALTIWPQWRAGVLVAIGLWMAAPGVALARATTAASERTGVLAWLVGPALGFGLSVFGIFPWWALGIQGWLAIVLGPAITWLLALAMHRAGAPRLRLPVFGHRDIRAAAAAMLIVPAITWAPYDHVREPVADGEAYRAYFTADFVWAMTVTAELARGDVPPANPFLPERPLNYYWFAHFLSGTTFRNLGPEITAEPVILINGLMFGAAFVLFAYALTRVAGASPALGAVAVVCAFCANSYEGADMIRSALTGHMPWAEFLNTNVDAVTRWFYHGMTVDGLQRLLLYQPHHLTGYALALCALWLVGCADAVSDPAIAAGAGTLLALALLFSTFNALIVAIAVGLLYLYRLAQQHALMHAWRCALLGGGPVLVGVMATSALGYTDTRYGALLRFGLNPVATVNVSRVWILSFGPLLFGAVAACVSWRWLVSQGATAAALVVSATAFYFFTNVPDSGDVWVGWRAGHMLLVAFMVMSGAWLTRAWAVPRTRLAVLTALGVLVLPAVPTVALDVYNAQDITNRREGVGFPWTLVITPGEREALEWVRRETPPHAVVQTEPDARGPAYWSYIGAFAERRMVAGLPGSMTPRAPYRHATDEVQWGVFRTTQAEDCHAAARALGIDYVFIGASERRRYAPAIAAMLSDPVLFPTAFRNDEVTILRVAPSSPGAGASRLSDAVPR